MTPAEVRELENLPFIEGSDTLMANAALQPMVTEPVPLALPAPERQLALPPVRSLLGRLGRVKTLDEIDVNTLPDGLSELFGGWRSSGMTIEAVRAHLAALMRNED